MSDETTRIRILDRFESDLKSLDYFQHIEINRMTVIDIDNVPFPSVFIYSGPERRLTDDRAVIGRENWEWKVFLEVYGENINLEVVLSRVHRVLFEDYTLGGNASEAVRSGVEMWVVDPDRILSAMLIEYTVVYRHVLGVM